MEVWVPSEDFVNPRFDLFDKFEKFCESLSCDEAAEIISFVGELSSWGDCNGSTNFELDGRVSMRVQRVLVRGGISPEDEDCVVTSLVTLVDEFPSDSFRVEVSGELPSKIGDKCAWEIR